MAESEGTFETLAECPSKQVLQDYLRGWSSPDQSLQIEDHLASCQDCDNALRSLDETPDTFMQSLQGTAVEPTAKQNPPATKLEESSRIEAALARSRQLMDMPARTSGQPTSAPACQPGDQVGVYKLQEPLGHGGMGAVYLATHSQLEKQVAIKLLPGISADNNDVRSRFQREIRVVGRLNHPAIVTATDAGESDNTPYLVMEYVAGRDLSRVTRTAGRLRIADACELMRQCELGLSCAHAEGVVHRDIKPSNLMLDESGQVKILDFGLAHMSFWNDASVELTTVGQLMGTLDYMAPEQAESCGSVDYRADLYAIGATLFRLLCGRPPLAAAPNQSPLEKLRLLANHTPPGLSVLCPDAPDELARLVDSLLARNPADRPASAAHVAEQLEAFTESADLPALLRQTKEQEDTSPEEFPGQHQQGIHPSESASPAGGSTGGRTGRFLRWIAAGAILPLLIAAGILIKLELDKGQLVIESEIDDLVVRVVGADESADDLSISTGTTATRLRAGRYELVIDGASDEVIVENQQFTIKNGGTIVARIRLRPVGEPRPLAQQQVTSPGGTGTSDTEQIYEGKPLREWLDLLGRERSTDGLRNAFIACRALTSPENSEQITSVILRILPGLDGERNLQNNPELGPRFIDRYATDILWRANPGPEFHKLWIREIEKAKGAWKERLWGIHGERYIQDVSTAEPFIAWADALLRQPVNAPPSPDSDRLKAADTLRILTAEGRDEETPELVDRILQALQAGRLPASWWVKLPLVYESSRNYRNGQLTEQQQLWAPAMRAHMTKVAIEVVNSRTSDAQTLAQACMILTNGAEIDQQYRGELLKAVNDHLIELCTKDEDSLFTPVDANQDFAQMTVPELRPTKQRNIAFSMRNRIARPFLVLELLDLIRELGGKAETADGIAAVCVRMRPIGALIVPETVATTPNTRGRSGFSSIAIQLGWPDLASSDSRTAVMNRRIWGEHEPTPRDWLGYCIMEHPVIYEPPPEPPSIEE